MRIIYSYQGKEAVFDREVGQVIVGRPKLGVAVDLDLTPDERVSRTHARVWVEYGQHWIEDLNSAHGTQVNGEEIKGKGKQGLQPGDTISIGETALRVEIPREQVSSVEALLTDAPESELIEVNEQSLDANEPAFASAEDVLTETDRRLALFYELPLQFGAETRLESLLQLIVERVIDVIPGAQRGALLSKDRATGELPLKAHWPQGRPAVSMTMAHQAMTQQKAFIWPPGEHQAGTVGDTVEPVPGSLAEHQTESTMYAPLLWKGDVLGVVCVDNCESCGAFQNDDLRLLQAVAHHAAMAIAHSYALDDLRQHAEITNRLFSSRFPPRARQKLMQEAISGTLTIGTQQSDITVLISDIRGFTELTARLGPQRMSDLLNEYFPPLIETIFSHEGTIERFVGDAIFAVFGSPESDNKQHEQAVRAALRMQAVMKEVSDLRAKRGAETCCIGIGIDYGKALHGFIGNAERMEYTVIGDAANRASRYCTGAHAGEVLISPEVYQWVYKIFEVEPATIQTKHEGDFPAYRIKRIKSVGVTQEG